MKKGLYVVAIFVSVLLIGLVSAGLLDSLRGIFTGHAIDNQSTNVSVTVYGVDPVTITLDTSTAVSITPIENSATYVWINATVCDPNGVSDINDSSVSVVYSNATVGESRSNTCTYIEDVSGQCANFTCNVTMWYWDYAGIWNINVTANDIGNQTPQYNDSESFTYQELKALVISPTQLNWTGIYPAAENETADNDPTIVNNTGNYNGTVNLSAYDLYGLTVTTEKFGVDNFTVEVVNASCGNASSAFLVNYTTSADEVLVINSEANKGNLSENDGSGQEDLYYCIPTVPQLSTQTYSTDQLGSWIISY